MATSSTHEGRLIVSEPFLAVVLPELTNPLDASGFGVETVIDMECPI